MIAKIKLPNNFMKGNCEVCPFRIEAYQDEIGDWGYYTYCLFHYEPEPDKVWNLTDCNTCKLEIEESEGEK